MKVSEYIEHLISGECSKLAIANVGDMDLNPTTPPTTVQVANQEKFISYINLANLALHKRFNLLRKTIELHYPTDGEEYNLSTDMLAPIRAYYAEDYEPVAIKDHYVRLVDSTDTAVSILLPEAFKAVIKGTDEDARDMIILEYSAAPPKALNAAHNLEISEAYTEPLLNYASYKAHSAISADMKDENNTHYLRYEASCKQLVREGMWGNNEIEYNSKLEDNGFV